MKTYKLYVCMSLAKFNVTVEAKCHTFENDRIIFWDSIYDDDAKEIASYPSKYTIIEKITENK
jgi:hypothetical protein